jgi:hypothetical protein
MLGVGQKQPGAESEVTKEVVGIHVLLPRSLFGGGTSESMVNERGLSHPRQATIVTTLYLLKNLSSAGKVYDILASALTRWAVMPHYYAGPHHPPSEFQASKVNNSLSPPACAEAQPLFQREPLTVVLEVI